MRNHPATVFDRAQWKLLPDPKGPREYANVSNVLEIVSGRAVIRVAVAVPTELFTFLREVAKSDPAHPVRLALDLVGPWYVFSVFIAGEDDKLIDLWAYAARGLPEWMLMREYQL